MSLYSKRHKCPPSQSNVRLQQLIIFINDSSAHYFLSLINSINHLVYKMSKKMCKLPMKISQSTTWRV